MIETRIPRTDSIEELAEFWQTHDLTDFQDELQEVREPVFARKDETVFTIQLPLRKAASTRTGIEG